MLQPMTMNVSDARLALHGRMTQVLVDLFADGDDYSEDDVDTAAEVVDELLNALGIEVIEADDQRIVFSIPFD